LPPRKRGGVYLPPLKVKIYDIIRRAPGIPTELIAHKVYGTTSLPHQRLVRVHVSQINDMLAGSGVCISGDGKFRESGYGRGEYRVLRV
jgi:hypothetical protein